jgi:U3 small nucleolar ribonucleoprotein component
MFIYVFVNGVYEQVFALTKSTPSELAQTIKEIEDKWGEDAITIFSHKNVTDPVRELILGEELQET